jgi:hypothetical protein
MGVAHAEACCVLSGRRVFERSPLRRLPLVLACARVPLDEVQGTTRVSLRQPKWVPPLPVVWSREALVFTAFGATWAKPLLEVVAPILAVLIRWFRAQASLRSAFDVSLRLRHVSFSRLKPAGTRTVRIAKGGCRKQPPLNHGCPQTSVCGTDDVSLRLRHVSFSRLKPAGTRTVRIAKGGCRKQPPLNHGCPWTKSKERMTSAFDSGGCRSAG